MDDKLRQRIQQLEFLETEHHNLRHLLDMASEGQNLERFSGNMILHAELGSGRIVDANELASELLGYSPAEFRGLRISDIEVLPDEPAVQPKQYMESSIETTIYECHYRQSDGRLTPVRVTKRQLTHEGLAVWHLSLEDLSLRQLVWKELSRREDNDFQFREKLKTLNEINAELGVCDSLDEVCRQAVLLGKDRLGFDRLSVWMFDAQTDRMHGTYGVDEHGMLRDERGTNWEIGGSPLVEFVHGSTTPIVTADAAPNYNNRSEIIGYGWHISAPLNYGGQFIGYMTADNFLNHQPMRNYQPELLRSFAVTLGHFVAHHRMRASTEKLSDTVHSKQERIQLLGTFITHIGHDFRTPLTLINTNAYLLRKTQDEARKVQLARNIEEQVDYINRVVQQMLESVALEEELDYAFQTVVLSEVLDRAAQSLAAIAAEKGIEWTVEPAPTVTLRADRELLERAIREILLNAIQYTNAGGRVCLSSSADENEVVIRVEDSGIGIAPGEIEKIFNHLYRVDPARTTQGVGLGLTLAKRVIEAHKGHIRVKSTLGAGSIFEIIVPLVPSGPDTESPVPVDSTG